MTRAREKSKIFKQKMQKKGTHKFSFFFSTTQKTKVQKKSVANFAGWDFFICVYILIQADRPEASNDSPP